jgi:hypothetical protein
MVALLARRGHGFPSHDLVTQWMATDMPIHFCAVRGEPLDVPEVALAAMCRVAGEEATSAEYCVLLAK